MSVDEIKYAIENRAGVLADDVDGKTLKQAGCWERVMVLPDKLHERIQYLGNTLVQMIPKKADDKLTSRVNQLCQALSYMLNSASWREGELFEFDLKELQRKLERFTG